MVLVTMAGTRKLGLLMVNDWLVDFTKEAVTIHEQLMVMMLDILAVPMKSVGQTNMNHHEPISRWLDYDVTRRLMMMVMVKFTW